MPGTFAIEIPRNLPILQTPRAPIEQIFRNLIGNAIKHHHRTAGKISVRAEERGEFVEFTVSDDGPGIPSDLHERAFAMFQTLKPRDEVEGTGIGLAFVKRLVEAHGGTVRLDSVEGSGASFHFTWPKVWSP
jgi:signal transduction histidine kinase